MAHPLVPAVVFAPGEYLQEALDDRGWTQGEFAEIIGKSPKTVNEIIKGRAAITPSMAKVISAALDTSPMLWLNLEASYRLHQTQEPALPRIARNARLRAKYPVREMVKRGWVPDTRDGAELERHVLAFFGVKDIDEPPQLAHAAKRTGYPVDLPGAQLTWLFRVRQIASEMVVPPYSAARLRNALPQLEALLMAPEEIRQVPRILAECGVRYVIVEHVPGSKIDGVCFWLDGGDKAPVIGMSLRLDKIDNFWFVLRHEIEHVLRGHGREVAIIDQDPQAVQDGVTEEERLANAAAEDFCVPHEEMEDFIIRHHPLFSEEKIENFARRMQVHPGLVVGQLQHRTGNYTVFRHYLVKVRPIIASAAMTDGYGQHIPLRR